MMNDEEKKFYVYVGNKIFSLRKSIKMKQHELAEILGLSRASVVNIEKGRQTPPLHTYWRISEIFRVSPDKILPINNQHLLSDDLKLKKKIEGLDDMSQKDKDVLSDLI
jgi:transcriptional regulator with XRE-family HTH domain